MPSLQLPPCDGAIFSSATQDVRVAADRELGMAKLRILDDEPDRWFERALGAGAPAALREVAVGPVECAWLAPGEWLATGSAADVADVVARCADAAGDLGLMVDVSHGRAAFDVEGSSAREVLSLNCPLDLSDGRMPVGAALRSVFSETTVFISRKPDRGGQPHFRVIFDQSMRSYAERMFSHAISGSTR